MMQNGNETKTGAQQEVMLPASDRKMMDAAIKTLQGMSSDERRLATAFMRGMRFQRMLDSTAAGGSV